MATRSWREKRIDELLAAVSELGMTMSRAAAGDLLDERVQFVANRMRVTPATARTYLTEEALAGMARQIVFGFVEVRAASTLKPQPFSGHSVSAVSTVVRVSRERRLAMEVNANPITEIDPTMISPAERVTGAGRAGVF